MATLAEILRQTGYSQDGTLAAPTPVEPTMTSILQKHITSLPQTTAQNLANQRQDIDAALQMTPQGMQIADKDAFNRFMNEMPNVAGMIKAVNGQPLTLYHGTKSNIDEFVPSKGGEYGGGIYFGETPEQAFYFAKNAKGIEGENIIPVNLDIKNPMNVTAYERDKVRSKSIKQLEKKGYDGIVATGLTGEKQYIAFRPEQVISTITKKPLTRKEIIEQEIKKSVE